MDLLLATTQGLGLSLASGLRSFLPPLLVGVLARSDAGVDFSGTDYAFLESTWFLAVALALNVIVFALGLALRRGPVRHPPEALLTSFQLAFGALLFAGSLAENGSSPWPGLPAGAALSLLAVVVSRSVFAGASQRQGSEAEADQAGSLEVMFDAAALVLTALAVFVSPLSLLALLGLLWLAGARRRRGARKYEGLRILR